MEDLLQDAILPVSFLICAKLLLSVDFINPNYIMQGNFWEVFISAKSF